jgi:cobalamin biosynthesis protein CobD/CbiB
VYPYYSPPYILLIAGLLVSITSGAAFEATLKLAVMDWSKNRSTRTLANLQGMQLLLPFLGICGGICLFLAAGLEIFGFPTWLSYAIALPLTLFIGLLIWTQLAQVLRQLERGGSQALDLDSFG